MRDINLIIAGFGVIGRGFARVLVEKEEMIKKDYGINLKVSAICEYNGSIICDERAGIDLKDALFYAEGKRLEKHPNWTSKASNEVIKDVAADILVELTPGNIINGEPGLSHIISALESKKHVVTSNKAPLALKFSELNDIAKKNNLKLKYEATVAGALPIINLYEKTLQVNKLNEIYGILNGTTNYILSKMTYDRVDFDTALREAQDAGFAESNPTYDINGYDTAAKVVILANALMNKKCIFSDVKITGIGDITQDVIELAKKSGYVIKLIGDVLSLEVSPRLIPASHPLNVSGSLNAIYLNTDVASEITVVGRGAGARETASSLFSDVLSIACEI